MSAALIVVALVVGPAATALAHDPIFMSDDQTTPDTGPFMPDGSISWALYGQVLAQGDTRGFEFDLRDGDEVYVSLLIPNLEPETALSDEELPTLELEAPDGTLTTIVPQIREIFDEPFSQTSYVTLAEYREPAQAGRYRGIITGNAPARFSVAIGETEIFFTETERSGERPTNFAEITGPLTAWYTTPPGGEQDTSQLAEGEAEIDLEMIEDAMDAGVADAPEGSTDSETDDAGEADESRATADAEPSAAGATEDSDGAEEGDDSDSSDTASAPIVADGDGGATWVAPVAIGVIAVLGGGAFLARRGGRKDTT